MARRRLSTPTPGTADRLVKTLSPRLPVCIACAEFYTAVDDRWKLRADRECGQRRAAEVGRSVEDFLCLRPSPARRRGTARIRTAREAAVDRQICAIATSFAMAPITSTEQSTYPRIRPGTSAVALYKSNRLALPWEAPSTLASSSPRQPRRRPLRLPIPDPGYVVTKQLVFVLRFGQQSLQRFPRIDDAERPACLVEDRNTLQAAFLHQ